jgi:hypothetical protein
MPTDDRDAGTGGRAPYEKPALKIIELVAEETLAVGCKSFPGGPGKTGSLCGNSLCSLSIGS